MQTASELRTKKRKQVVWTQSADIHVDKAESRTKSADYHVEENRM